MRIRRAATLSGKPDALAFDDVSRHDAAVLAIVMVHPRRASFCRLSFDPIRRIWWRELPNGMRVNIRLVGHRVSLEVRIVLSRWACVNFLGSQSTQSARQRRGLVAVSYTHLRAHETPEHLVC